MSSLSTLARVIASGFGSGFLKPAPGSWGSAAAVLIWWALGAALSSWSLVFFAVLLVCSLCAIMISIRHDPEKDPQWIVIDEWVGQWITLLMMGLLRDTTSPLLMLIGFLLFRIFDASKISLVGRAEALPGAIGILMDDVVAGLYAGSFGLLIGAGALMCGVAG